MAGLTSGFFIPCEIYHYICCALGLGTKSIELIKTFKTMVKAQLFVVGTLAAFAAAFSPVSNELLMKAAFSVDKRI